MGRSAGLLITQVYIKEFIRKKKERKEERKKGEICRKEGEFGTKND